MLSAYVETHLVRGDGMQVNGQIYYGFFVNDLFGHQSFVKKARQRELAGTVASLLLNAPIASPCARAPLIDLAIERAKSASRSRPSPGNGHAAQAWLVVDVRLAAIVLSTVVLALRSLVLARRRRSGRALPSPSTKPADIAPETCTLHQNRRNGMFEINGLDTAGVVSLKRLSLAAAVKKARELVEDGCWDVQVVDPNGRVYTSFEEQAA